MSTWFVEDVDGGTISAIRAWERACGENTVVESESRLNVENINIVADALERGSPELDLDQEYWAYDSECGTSACIAGWTVFIFEPAIFSQYLDDDQSADISEIATRYLGLDVEQTGRLFHFVFNSNPKIAARVLRHLAETGKVEWDINPEPEIPTELTDILKMPSENKELVNQE